MTNLYGNTTKLFSTPYITPAEYKAAPTAIDYDNLVADSTNAAVQDAELKNAIARGSSWMDTFCNQSLGANTVTEQQRSRLRPEGFIAIHPRYSPVVALTELYYGITPNDLVQYPDPSQGWIEDEQFIVPYTAANISYSSQGPLQFGMPAIPRAPIFCKYTYINGYASTTLSANASASATSITVANPVGITAGLLMTIYNGANTETITVDSTYTFGSTTIPLSAPLVYAQTSGVGVSALPPAVKEAAILATTAMIKVRGDYSLTMQVSNMAGQATVNADGTGDLNLAKELLMPYRRIR
jgi:hypothetical protein